MLSERLRFKMTDGTTYTLLSQYVSRYRQCNLDFCQVDGFSSQNRNDKSKKIRLNLTSPTHWTENTVSHLNTEHCQSSISTNYFFRLGHLKERLIKEGQCFKYGKQDHLSSDPDA